VACDTSQNTPISEQDIQGNEIAADISILLQGMDWAHDEMTHYLEAEKHAQEAEKASNGEEAGPEELGSAE
jgi:hypothetical protein